VVLAVVLLVSALLHSQSRSMRAAPCVWPYALLAVLFSFSSTLASWHTLDFPHACMHPYSGIVVLQTDRACPENWIAFPPKCDCQYVRAQQKTHANIVIAFFLPASQSLILCRSPLFVDLADTCSDHDTSANSNFVAHRPNIPRPCTS
jgi:hypothetical protein